MGMPVTVEVAAESDTAEAAIEAVFAWFGEVDRTYSPFKAYSVISRLREGQIRLGEAPNEVREVLAAGKAMKGVTDGFFDMQRPDGRLDPSGYVKGWAIERAAEQLERRALHDYCIEAGGDIQTGGKNTKGKPWRVGIRNPERPAEIVKVLHVRGQAVATSGNYERGAHIYDPKTGHATGEVASVTVVGPRITWVDVAATAAFAMGTRAAAWIAQQPDLEAYVIDHSGRATLTPRLEQYL